MKRIFLLTADLMAGSQVTSLAKQLNVPIEWAMNSNAWWECFSESGEPTLAIVDLALAGLDIVAFANACRSRQSSRLTLVGFYPHVQADLESRAVEGGMDLILTRGQLHGRLKPLIDSFVQLQEAGSQSPPVQHGPGAVT